MSNLLAGFASIANPECIILVIAGTVLGIIFGAIPGLSANIAVALCLPITFSMEPIPAFCLLIGLYLGSLSGGLISAILLNIPGTPASIATCFDGAPMARRGEAGKALGVGILYSFIGGGISIIMLIYIAPLVSKIAMKFGPWEYLAVTVFSLTMVASLISEDALKGLASAVLGIMLAQIGSAPIDAALRYTFGWHQLDAGLKLLPFLIGLFAIAEVLKTTQSGRDVKASNIIKYKVKGFGVSLREFFDQFGNMIRSALIGTGIGILPGIGGGTSNMISYIAAKNRSKHPEKFGTGVIDGIIASETANNASVGGALIPLLTLGIPGDAVTAILLGALTLHGIVPGPAMFTMHADVCYAIFAALVLSNVVMIVLEYLGIPVFVRILRIPNHILLPIVMLLCMVGAFGTNNRIFDVWCILFFGVIGFVLEKNKFPLAPAILGFILGPTLEANLQRGLMSSSMSFAPLVTRPIAAAFMGIAVLSLVLSVIKNIRKSKAAPRAEA